MILLVRLVGFCCRNAHLLDALSRADQQQMQWRASLQRLLEAQAAVEGQIRAAAIVHAGGGADGRGAAPGASAEGGEISAQLLSRVEAMRRDLDEVCARRRAIDRASLLAT